MQVLVNRSVKHEFQTSTEIAKLKILKPGQTRWVSLEQCVNRLIEQREAHVLHLNAEVFEDKISSNQKLLLIFKNTITITNPYLLISSYALGQFKE